MTLDDLYRNLKDHFYDEANATFSLPWDGLSAQLVQELIKAEYDKQTLVLSGVTQFAVKPTESVIEIKGTQTFLNGTSSEASVVFQVIDNEAILINVVPLLNGWHFANAYPVLNSMMIDSVTFNDAKLVVSSNQLSHSSYPDMLEAGINFVGQAQVSGDFSLLSLFFGALAKFTLHGTVKSGINIPDIKIGSVPFSPVTLGYFKDLAFTLNLVSSSKQTNSWIALDADIPADGPQPIKIETQLIQYHAPITFVANLSGAEIFPLHIIDNLLNGVGLKDTFSSLPSFDFFNDLKLKTVTLVIQMGQLIGVDVSVGIDKPWAPFAELAFDRFNLGASLSFPNGYTKPAVSGWVSGEAPLGQGNLMLSASGPPFQFQGEYAGSVSLNLSQALSSLFKGNKIPLPDFSLSAVSFEGDPGADTYSLSCSFGAEINWSKTVNGVAFSLNDTVITLHKDATYCLGNHDFCGSAKGHSKILSEEFWFDINIPGGLVLIGKMPTLKLKNLVPQFGGKHLWIPETIGELEFAGYFQISDIEGGPVSLSIGEEMSVDHEGSKHTWGDVEFKAAKQNDTHAIAIGFILAKDFKLAWVDSHLGPLDKFSFPNLYLGIFSSDMTGFKFDTYDKPNFQFPAVLSAFGDNPKEGVVFGGEINLDNTLKTVKHILPKVATLQLDAEIPNPIENFQLDAKIVDNIPLIPKIKIKGYEGGIELNYLELAIEPLKLDVQMTLHATIDINGSKVGVQGDTNINPDRIEFELETTSPWPNAMGIKNLTLEKIGFAVDAGANDVIKFIGSVKVDVMTLSGFIEFNITEDGTPDAFRLESKESGHASLGQIIKDFTHYQEGALFDVFNEITIKEFMFMVVLNPFGFTWDNKPYDPGMAFACDISIYGFEAAGSLTIDFEKGMTATAHTNKPIVLGSLLTISDTIKKDQGPFFHLSTESLPFVNTHVHISLLRVESANVDMQIDDKEAHFHFDETVKGLDNVVFDLGIKRNGIDIGAHITADAHYKVPTLKLKFGSLDIGTVHSDSSFDIEFYLGVDAKAGLKAHFCGQITLLSHHVKLPSIDLNESTTEFENFAKQVIDNVESHLWNLIKDWFGTAATYINFIKSGVVKEVGNIVAALRQAFGRDVEEIGSLIKDVKGILQLGANEVTTLLKAEFAGVAEINTRITKALYAAEFDAPQIGAALHKELHIGVEDIAKILRSLHRPLGDIATAMRNSGDEAWNDAKKIARFFKDEWHEDGHTVKAALETAKFSGDQIKSALKDVFDWFKKAAHKVKHWFKKHY